MVRGDGRSRARREMRERPHVSSDTEPRGHRRRAKRRTLCDAREVASCGAVTGGDRFMRESGAIRTGIRRGPSVEAWNGPPAWYQTSEVLKAAT